MLGQHAAWPAASLPFVQQQAKQRKEAFDARWDRCLTTPLRSRRKALPPAGARAARRPVSRGLLDAAPFRTRPALGPGCSNERWVLSTAAAGSAKKQGQKKQGRRRKRAAGRRRGWNFEYDGPRAYGPLDHDSARVLQGFLRRRRSMAGVAQRVLQLGLHRAATTLQRSYRRHFLFAVYALAKLKRARQRAATTLACRMRMRMASRKVQDQRARRMSSQGHWDKAKEAVAAVSETDRQQRRSIKLLRQSQRQNSHHPPSATLLAAVAAWAETAASTVRPPPGAKLLWSGNYSVEGRIAAVQAFEMPDLRGIFLLLEFVASRTKKGLVLRPREWKHLGGPPSLAEYDKAQRVRLAKTVCDELVEMDAPEPHMLESVPMFGVLPHRIRHDLLRKVRKRRFRAGRVVCRQGEVGDGMYFVKAGALKVFVNGRLQQIMVAPAFFGEVSLMTSTGLRTATVATLEESELFVLRRADFNQVLELHPDICQRLHAEHHYEFDARSRAGREGADAMRARRRGSVVVFDEASGSAVVTDPSLLDEGTRRRAIVSPIPAIPGEETKPADHKLASVNGVLGVLKKGGRPSSPYSG
jgi:hypothetical protein